MDCLLRSVTGLSDGTGGRHPERKGQDLARFYRTAVTAVKEQLRCSGGFGERFTDQNPEKPSLVQGDFANSAVNPGYPETGC